MTKLSDGDSVTHPDWNDGKPVRITRLGDGAVRYQDAALRSRAVHVHVGDDTQIKQGGA